MNSYIFGRKWRLKVGGQTGTITYEIDPKGQGLRIGFMVTHFAGGALSLADITIYNLGKLATQRLLGLGDIKKYDYISLEAGYEPGIGFAADHFDTIFIGEITNSHRVLEEGGVTRGIRMFCKSSAKARDQDLINISLSPETEPQQIIRRCAAAFGNLMEFYGDFSTLRRRARGTVLHGSIAACMDALSQAFGFRWMIENGITKIIKNDHAQQEIIYVLRSDSGLIGSPIVTDTEVGIRCRMNPKIKLGDTVKLESMAPQFEFSGAFFYNVPRTIGEGYYKANAIVHTGDSYSNVWESQLTCLRLDSKSLAEISERTTR